MKLEWSADALADLNRFAQFLQDRHPLLASTVASKIMEKAVLLAERPRLGRAIEGRDDYRQAVLQVLNAQYVFQYRCDRERIVMLRVFHGREARK
jgi:toxin ParE1/3/4